MPQRSSEFFYAGVTLVGLYSPSTKRTMCDEVADYTQHDALHFGEHCERSRKVVASGQPNTEETSESRELAGPEQSC